MKNHHILLMTAALIIGLASCKKEKHESNPLVGKVMLINSETPVDQALVRFIRQESNGLFEPYSYYIQQEVITGPDGTFVIPDTTTADYVQAWGRNSVFYGAYSVEEYLSHYLAVGGVPKLYLRPPAWIRVKAVDVEPLNPEIVVVQLNATPNVWPINWEGIDSEGLLWRRSGNVELTWTYRLINLEVNDPTIYTATTQPFAAFDTTEYIIEY